jgi:hypothetical protein
MLRKMKSKKMHKNKCLLLEAGTKQFKYETTRDKMKRPSTSHTESVYHMNVQRMTPRRNRAIKAKDK